MNWDVEMQTILINAETSATPELAHTKWRGQIWRYEVQGDRKDCGWRRGYVCTFMLQMGSALQHRAPAFNLTALTTTALKLSVITPRTCVWSVCVPIDSVLTHKRVAAATAAAEGDMSIYNLGNSHLIVFDRGSLQINNSRRQPHMCIYTWSGGRHTMTPIIEMR